LDLKYVDSCCPGRLRQDVLVGGFFSPHPKRRSAGIFRSLDTDPKRFLTHFIASIQSKFSNLVNPHCPALAELSQDKFRLNGISAIVNDAYEHISEHFIFVLDDYHW
jgi:hypothetical protein